MRDPLMQAAESVASTGTAPAPAEVPAAAAPAPAADESLLPPPSAAPAAAPAAQSAEHGWLPEKFRVVDADGKVDAIASGQKLAESYRNLEKVKGSAVVPPATPADYSWTPPEEFKDLKFDDALSQGFRERAHKAGLSQQQYEFIMGEYTTLVPEMLNGVASATAAEARAELSKVWPTSQAFESNINNAARAINSAPESLRADLHARYGRDPVFLQFAASIGREMREDTGVQNADGGNTGQTIEQLMAHPAYRDQKHPEHAAVSARVQAAAKRITPA